MLHNVDPPAASDRDIPRVYIRRIAAYQTVGCHFQPFEKASLRIGMQAPCASAGNPPHGTDCMHRPAGYPGGPTPPHDRPASRAGCRSGLCPPTGDPPIPRLHVISQAAECRCAGCGRNAPRLLSLKLAENQISAKRFQRNVSPIYPAPRSPFFLMLSQKTFPDGILTGSGMAAMTQAGSNGRKRILKTQKRARNRGVFPRPGHFDCPMKLHWPEPRRSSGRDGRSCKRANRRTGAQTRSAAGWASGRPASAGMVVGTMKSRYNTNKVTLIDLFCAGLFLK